MSNLIPPHGGKGLTCCLLEGAELEAEKKKAEGLKKISISPRAGRTGKMSAKTFNWPMGPSGPSP